MRLVFVNYAHPDTPHVSGMRLRYFADALAKRGHKIVLITSTLADDDITLSPMEVAAELENHDWSQPYHLACPPARRWSLERIRNPRTQRRLRQVLVAWNFFARNGVFSDWTDGTQPYWPVLVEKFQPQAAWGTFLPLDSWAISRGIARQASIPWMMDAKDGWEAFIPVILQKLLAKRFSDAAAVTANSTFFGLQFKKWFPQQATVIYSGADTCWFKLVEAGTDKFRITIVGGIYSDARFRGFLQGLRSWLESMSEAQRCNVVLSYAGGDVERVRTACELLKGLCELDFHGYLLQDELAHLCRISAVNAYIWSSSTFHHKVVELLCARRPIIAFPGEYPEAIALAAEVGGELYPCEDGEAVVTALAEIWVAGANVSEPEERLQMLSWDGQAERLEIVFREVTEKTGVIG